MTDMIARLLRRRTFDTAEPGAGGAAEMLTGKGGEAPGGNAGDGAPPAQGGDTGGAGPGAPADAGTGGAPWWQDTKRFDEPTRRMLEAKGLTVDDPIDAMGKMAGLYRNAEQRLGKPADQLMERPGKDQDVADWMKANAELFGIPDKPDAYKIEKPEGWPKDAPWDEGLEAKARQIGVETGLSEKQLSAVVGLYAEHVAGTLGEAEAGMKQANDQLQAELQKDWGDQYGAKVAAAQQAFQAAAEAAGLDGDGALNAAQVLSDGGKGDANVLRLFAALGDMMGEDSLPRVGGASAGLSTTPAEARAELAAMQAPGSPYAQAVADRRAGKPVANWDDLHKRRLSLEKIASQSG